MENVVVFLANQYLCIPGQAFIHLVSPFYYWEWKKGSIYDDTVYTRHTSVQLFKQWSIRKLLHMCHIATKMGVNRACFDSSFVKSLMLLAQCFNLCCFRFGGETESNNRRIMDYWSVYLRHLLTYHQWFKMILPYWEMMNISPRTIYNIIF